MIASLRGTVLQALGTVLVVDVHGVGYAVTVTPEHALAVRSGEEVLVHTAMVVREDDMSLFGFQDRERLEVFDLLRGVTGVGPKSAMGVLAALSPEEIAAAVANDDDAAFRRVSGIGPKTAKLIVVSLTGKLIAIPSAAPATRRSGAVRGADVLVALVGLGYQERAAQAALDEVLADRPDERQTSVLLRAALAQLGPQAVR
ncbi:Holliday junction branch migration protein RuvA [Amnibacterium kyonggiense]|uniref:Holliday junction branch migration complex subunit RuvA n=1 Tax=Amnibacterium kyonggiense TaxID=595671 RepID=A0A4R7FM39_9MICO|nr:Holliday junction branch migration protein RuvA [Amnibacterium kyonggiense]TDS77487.1 Holliday junction DNA helicase subunit RuvA [Amnibacterium kyonggiense]